NFAATSGWSIHVGTEMPPSPDTCILIKDGPGANVPNPNFTYEYPTVQILVRGAKGDYLLGYAKATAIKNNLNGRKHVVVNDAEYIQIVCSSDIFPLGRDTNQRPLFSLNFELQRTSST
ncbi:MAG: minor capsid protein, partial [Gammaproteobacteria bacterium]|nr:minor capsid protein [Gammaproteobacteria bacterium]